MKKRRKLTAAALLLVTLTTIYCSYDLDAEDWEIPSRRLPAAFDGLRITLLTDIHGTRFGENNTRLLEAVAAAKPDHIAISGDLVDEATDPDMLEPLLTGLTQIAPTWYVTGNHEWSREDTEEILDRIAACGVTVLRNDYTVLQQDGQQIILAGAEDPNGYKDMETPQALTTRIRQEVPGDPYICMLYHRNNRLDLWSGLEVDTVLSGHGHGGVIKLPILGGLLGVERNFFPKDCEGLYTRGRTTLAVSRGLGGLRLWNRPHLPTIVLRSMP